MQIAPVAAELEWMSWPERSRIWMALFPFFTEAGKGTTFRIELPLTLAITDALIATADAQTFAIHRSSVQEVIEIEPDSIKVIENNEIILHRDEVLPLVRLSRVFNLKDKKEGSLHAFVIGTGNRATGLVVDKVLGLREVVVRSLSDPLTDVPGVGGATELGTDGQFLFWMWQKS
jgi:two-component system chemotaxis sensor kinase CheA